MKVRGEKFWRVLSILLHNVIDSQQLNLGSLRQFSVTKPGHHIASTQHQSISTGE